MVHLTYYFLVAAVPFSIPSNSVQGFQFLHIHVNTYLFFFLTIGNTILWFWFAFPCRLVIISIFFIYFSLISSVGRECTCNAEDPGSLPGLGRSTGEGIRYPLQYSWALLVAHLVKNPPAIWETWIRSLGWENLLEKGTATHSIILAWRIPWTV